MGCRAFCSRSRTKTTCSTRVCEAFAALCPEQYPLTFHRIPAMIACRDHHIAVALPRHEPLLSEAEIGVAVSCLRSAYVLRRENHGRAPCGHAALDGRRARRRSAAAQHARIRGLGVRAGAGSGAAEDRSAQITELAATRDSCHCTILTAACRVREHAIVRSPPASRPSSKIYIGSVWFC